MAGGGEELMVEGETRRLFGMLVFDVELIKIEK